MQPTPSHHWFSSLLTGLCVVAGFGLGIGWHDWRHSAPSQAECRAAESLSETLAPDDFHLCAVQADEDDDTDKAQEKPKSKPRPRTFVRPRGLTEEHMKRVEEALRRAEQALEKEGQELPEDFRKHLESFRKQMAEHQKLLEEQFRQMELQFPKWQDLEGFPENFRGLESLPRSGHFFRFPENLGGSGVSITVNRDNDSFTVERREGDESIKVTGTLEDGKGKVTFIVIKDGGKAKTYQDVKDVPADMQDRVKELIEMGTTGRVMVRPGSPSPKKENKRAPAKEQEFF